MRPTAGWYVEIVYRNLPAQDDVVLMFGPMREYTATRFINRQLVRNELSKPHYYAQVRHSGDEGPSK